MQEPPKPLYLPEVVRMDIFGSQDLLSHDRLSGISSNSIMELPISSKYFAEVPEEGREYSHMSEEDGRKAKGTYIRFCTPSRTLSLRLTESQEDLLQECDSNDSASLISQGIVTPTAETADYRSWKLNKILALESPIAKTRKINKPLLNEPPIKYKDALAYLQAVKTTFRDNPLVYSTLLAVLSDMKVQSIDSDEASKCIFKLFKGHRRFIIGFHFFMPLWRTAALML